MERCSARRLTFAIASLVLVIAACGGDDTTEAATGENGDTTEAATGGNYVSPINEFLGGEAFDFSGDLSDEDRARLIEQEVAREEVVAQCMAEEGFEYTPRAASVDLFFGPEGEDGIQYGTREYAEKYGFGLSTQRYTQEEVGPELVGFDESFIERSDADSDPNFAYMESLDEATRQAYQEALFGPADQFPAFDPETMTEEELAAAEQEAFVDFEPQGCLNAPSSDQSGEAFFREFSNELEELYGAVLDDPRVREATDEINACIVEEGFEPLDLNTGPSQAFEADIAEVDELVGQFPGADLTGEDIQSMSEEELDALGNQPREFSDEAKTKLAEIQQREIEYAIASFDCGASPTEPPAEFFEVLPEYELQFLENNADQLDEYRDSLSDG